MWAWNQKNTMRHSAVGVTWVIRNILSMLFRSACRFFNYSMVHYLFLLDIFFAISCYNRTYIIFISNGNRATVRFTTKPFYIFLSVEFYITFNSCGFLIVSSVCVFFYLFAFSFILLQNSIFSFFTAFLVCVISFLYFNFFYFDFFLSFVWFLFACRSHAMKCELNRQNLLLFNWWISICLQKQAHKWTAFDKLSV